jgi:hypothetical protein
MFYEVMRRPTGFQMLTVVRGLCVSVCLCTEEVFTDVKRLFEWHVVHVLGGPGKDTNTPPRLQGDTSHRNLDYGTALLCHGH